MNIKKLYCVIRRKIAPRAWISTYNLQRSWNAKIAKRVNSRSVLTVEQKREVKRYWSRWTGIPLVSHAYYTEKTGVFRFNYIPDGLYYAVIDRYFSNWLAASFIDNKLNYESWFRGIKQPKIICYRAGGLWFDQERRLISLEEVKNRLKGQKKSFFKVATNLSGGSGVFCIKGEEVETELPRALVAAESADVIVQEPICQCAELNRLNKSSVNTIRAISLLRKDGSVKIYSVILRIGRNGSVVDNASSGGITCGVEADGRLKKVAYSVAGEKFFEHPDTHVKFDEIVVPCYDKLAETVCKAHLSVPQFKLISWDFAVDQNNELVLIEGNLSSGELDFHQLNNGPLFGEDQVKILDEVFGVSE